jgi:hypothetical protein
MEASRCPRLTVPHVVEVVFSGAVEAVHHHQEVVDSMVAMGVAIYSASPRTNSLHVKQVLSKNNLPCVSDVSSDSICDACQQAKSHQLSYPKSFSTSQAPLEVIFSDVWGPACASIGRYKYYVSFIDDFSKFTWIYLLKQKSEVF